METIKNELKKIWTLQKHVVIAFAVLGLVLSGSVFAESGGTLETIKDAVIALTVKVLNLETRVVALEENANVEEGTGGVTNFDQVDVAWINTGDVASTTVAQGIWKAQIRLRLASGDADAYWKNDTGGNVYAVARYVSLIGTASSSMTAHIATTTALTLTDYTYDGGIGLSAKNRMGDMMHWAFATSTDSAVVGGGYASSSPSFIKPSEVVVFELQNKYPLCVGGSDTAVLTDGSNNCEAATSSTRGFLMEAVIDVFATSTPKGQF